MTLRQRSLTQHWHNFSFKKKYFSAKVTHGWLLLFPQILICSALKELFMSLNVIMLFV
jgi:hypothetical protein